MKEHCPFIKIVFVPANMTELCQPLDVAFNFEFKQAVAAKRCAWLAGLAMAYIQLHGQENAANFRPPKELKVLKEKLVLLIAETANEWRTEAKMEQVSRLQVHPVQIVF
jgi:hypothetical protein